MYGVRYNIIQLLPHNRPNQGLNDYGLRNNDTNSDVRFRPRPRGGASDIEDSTCVGNLKRATHGLGDALAGTLLPLKLSEHGEK